MTISLSQALTLILDDLEATGMRRPSVEESAWQTWQPSESALVGGAGVWLDLSLPDADAVVHLADQVQDWAVEELWEMRLPTNWPECGTHPHTHPMQAAVVDGRPLWECPGGGPARVPIGGLRANLATYPIQSRAEMRGQ